MMSMLPFLMSGMMGGNKGGSQNGMADMLKLFSAMGGMGGMGGGGNNMADMMKMFSGMGSGGQAQPAGGAAQGGGMDMGAMMNMFNLMNSMNSKPKPPQAEPRQENYSEAVGDKNPTEPISTMLPPEALAMFENMLKSRMNQ